ncbi:MAG: N-6 DNA methylase [Planctomycetaceae bacterium]|nr:N-6 DNA methylase [Planctomycetaceae bacterium]
MKLYAFITPEIAKHAGFLKIGETHGNVETRVKQQGHELNVKKEIIWTDAVITGRVGIDKMVRRYLKEQGFHIQQFGTGWDTEWVKCTIGDLEKAFEIIKQQIYDDEKQREEVGKQFYLEIRNWFYWTTQDNKKIDDDYALRLVIRLLFCFFLREKDELVPKELLDANITTHLKNDEEYSYYNGILRNLFFHCLNTSGQRKYENEKLLTDKNMKKRFTSIPFLNGGLFDIHDKDDIPIANDYFFSNRRTRTLNELGETCDVYGIITILSKYQYKLTLDDLLEQAEYKTVDPEFIGKVFESLLSCIDSDSIESRRKVTGSYYTPRKIVDYMVNEALDAYLEQSRNRKIAQNDSQSYDCGSAILLQCRILDPACGSGAFPCGIMNEMMRRLDPHNTLTQSERYYKKLKIIQEVIYGVDIQPMAVLIAQLRLFLSLIQEITPDKKRNNFDIEPLPNLETKFVCADTLIGLKKNKQKTLESPIVSETITQLQETRNQYFMASCIREKKRLRKYDETLRKTLKIAMEHSGILTHEATEKLATWNPYDSSRSVPFFDSEWMFSIDNFDIVIGNPPYVESRSASVSAELKTTYQDQVKSDFGGFSQYITRGSDLLIYFFPRSISLLADDGIGMLIVQNGWLNTEYGVRASQFLVKTLQRVKIIDSSFRHFDRASANVNTVIVQFKKQSEERTIDFDIMKREGERIVTEKGKSFDLGNSILSDMKWGTIIATDGDVLLLLNMVIEKGKTLDQSFYSIGQGINVSQNTFIPKQEKQKFAQKSNIINAVFKEYQYSYTKFDYFLYHSFKPNQSDVSILETIDREEFVNGKSFTRSYPSIIMPRGIGALHFAGLVNGKALSNSFVDVYMNKEDEEKKLNIWFFCNSSLFFLYRELSGRKNLGGGLLKSEAADIKLFPLYFPIADTETILSIVSEMGEPVNLPDRLKTSVQQRIDDLVFSYFKINSKKQTKMINELLRQFQFRCNKAKN